MAAGLEVKGKDSLKTFINMLDTLPTRLQEAGRAWMDEVTTHAAERAELNAPILTGLLRSECRPSEIKVGASVVTGGVEDPVPYALHLHEDPGWGLGPISRIQPKMEEGGPAPGPSKYIWRVLIYGANVERYLGLLRDVIWLALNGKEHRVGRMGVMQHGIAFRTGMKEFLKTRRERETSVWEKRQEVFREFSREARNWKQILRAR